MKPPLGFIVLALVWSVPLATFAMWHVRRAEQRARGRMGMAVDQINTDASMAGAVSPRVRDSRSHVLVIRQFRARAAGAGRLARTIQALVPIR
jgi:hypothetical protein